MQRSLLEVLESSTEYLEKHQVEHPRLNAEHLIAHVLGKKNRLELYLEFDRPMGEADLAPLRELIRQRGQRVPLQHLLGSAEFCGHSFRCDKRALIPRPETERLVELIQAKIPAAAASILDMGTGSGVIAISLALALPTVKVTAVDISPEALSLAKENATRLEVQNLEFFHGDLFEPLSEKKNHFDLIVANLPYIPTTEIPTLSKEVQHDPHSALDGGASGLALIERIIIEAPAFFIINQPAISLKNPTMLALEIANNQGSAVVDFLQRHGYEEITVEKDYCGMDRFVFATISL